MKCKTEDCENNAIPNSNWCEKCIKETHPIHLADKLFVSSKGLIDIYKRIIEEKDKVAVNGFIWPIDTLITHTSNLNMVTCPKCHTEFIS